MPVPISITSSSLDLSQRIGETTTVAASPALAAETTIATLTLPTDVVVESGALLFGFAAWTVGAGGTAVTLRIRETTIAGTIIASTGAMSQTAGNLDSGTVLGFDATVAAAGTVYLLTMQVTGGGAASTVSAAELVALIV